ALARWPALIRSRLRYAEALRSRMHPSDAAAADRQLAAAAEEASTLGLALPYEATPPSGWSAVCTRRGSRWQVDLGGRNVTVAHSVGMLHLAVLIANPGVEVAASDLVAGVEILGAVDGGRMSAQPMLERAAVQRYRQRLSQLREEIDGPAAGDDPDRPAQARAERDWLLAELAAGTGI